MVGTEHAEINMPGVQVKDTDPVNPPKSGNDHGERARHAFGHIDGCRGDREVPRRSCQRDGAHVAAGLRNGERSRKLALVE